MKYNIQIDADWCRDIMTEGTDKRGISWVDYLGWRGPGNAGYGCVVAATANIQQEHSNVGFTPKKLNEILKSHKGYYWLSGKTDLEPTASFIDWQVVSRLFGFSVAKRRTKDYIWNKNIYYMARVENKYGGHYVNVLKQLTKDRFLCFDTLTEAVDITSERKITSLTEIIYRS